MTGDDTVHLTLVGHCGPDVFMMKNAISRFLDHMEIATVSTWDELETVIGDTDLLLINRQLDGTFPTALGQDLIGYIRETMASVAPPMMLISNFPEAQQEAEDKGAVPGFGKGDLYGEETRIRLLGALGIRAKA